jgi:SpoVK/Ycf46/Vps4 family AAA+-type ATPase
LNDASPGSRIKLSDGCPDYRNLNRVFDQAQIQGWILFFDEADALFGRRTRSNDAHDRYANSELAFLLQRMETFDGISILASNRRGNLDEALARRFSSVIHFPMPKPDERLLLWRRGFSGKARLEEALDLKKIARDHVLSGGSIMNVIRYAALRALEEGTNVVTCEDVLKGIRREMAREGKAGRNP